MFAANIFHLLSNYIFSVFCVVFSSFYCLSIITTIWWSASWQQSFCFTKRIWFVTFIYWAKSVILIVADNVLWFWLVADFLPLTVLNDSEAFTSLVLFPSRWFSARIFMIMFLDAFPIIKFPMLTEQISNFSNVIVSRVSITVNFQDWRFK